MSVRSFGQRGSLSLLLVVVLGVGFVAYAQLGGSSGIVLPYQGTLYSGSVPVSGDIDLSFEIYNQASGGTACQSVAANQTSVSNGVFSVALSLSDGCVRGRDVWLALTVDGTPIDARQRVYPALGAMTSGSGDFNIGGHLSADSADIVTSLVAGDIGSDTVATDDLEVTGAVTIRSGGTGTATIEAGKTLVVTGNFGGGEADNGGIEFRHDNLSQGIGFGYQTIYATGSNANQPLRLESRGTETLQLNPDANAAVVVGGELLTRASNITGGSTTRYSRSLERYRIVAPYTGNHYRSYTPISEALLVSLCGDGDGCTVTVRMVNWGAAATEQTSTSRGPYHFDYGYLNGSGRAWRVSTDAAGIDGANGTQHAVPAWDCYFTDGQYFQGNTSNNDNGRGMGLLNSGDTYAAQCELIIDD